ncbi:MAG: BatD family protein [Planctomycetaceae bacterium]|nr:BatD family protein [Planctomycetaceae bacterium]
MFRTILLLLFFQLFGSVIFAGISASVMVDRAVIYKGERIFYRIVVTDTAQPLDDSIEPDMSGYVDFDINVLPKQAVNNSSSSIRVVINGKEIRNESSTQSSVIFTYELLPKRDGKLLIPAPVILSKGNRVVIDKVIIADKSGVGNVDGSVPVTVKLPEEQDIVKMRVEADRNRVYPFQYFNVVLIVQVKSLPSAIMQSDASPLAVLRDPPNIILGWANDNALQRGLRPATPMNEWLSSIRAGRSQRGFSINDYAARGIGFDDDFFGSSFSSSGFGDIMSDMMRGRVLHFAPPPKKVTLRDNNGVDAIYWEYRFERKFLSSEIGDYKFGAVLKGNFAAADSASREGASLRRIYAVAQDVLVNVIDVPVLNRPASYVGAFGKFNLVTDIQPRKAKRGEPMTLTLKLLGEGSTGNIKPPDLNLNQEVAANFKTHTPTEEGDDKSCTFTYPIRATGSGNIIFPSIPVTYFDVQEERFVTLQSDAISLDISDVEQLSGNFIFGNNNSPGANFVRSEGGLMANMTGRFDAVDRSVNYFKWALFIVVLCLLYLFLCAILFLQRRLNSDPQKRRRSGAIIRAKNRLLDVQKNLKNAKPADIVMLYSGELQNLLFGYIADLGCLSENAMTTKDAWKKYVEYGGNEKIADDLRNVLETLDGAKYGGLDLKSFDDLITTIENILTNPPKFTK